MKIASSLVFALGIMIAISGGAKMPHVALTGSVFMAGLEGGKYDATNVYDLLLGANAATFYDRSADDREGLRTPYKVRLASDDGEENAQIVALLEEKSIGYHRTDTEEQLAVPMLPSTWPLFIAGAALGLVGLVLWRVATKAEAQASRVGDAEEDVHDPVTLLQQMEAPLHALHEESAKLTPHEITVRIDDITEQYILPFAEVRHGLIDRFGTAAGAEVLVTMAYAERMLNRAWSAAADEHLAEARNSIPDVIAGIEEANRLVKQFVSQAKTTTAS